MYRTTGTGHFQSPINWPRSGARRDCTNELSNRQCDPPALQRFEVKSMSIADMKHPSNSVDNSVHNRTPAGPWIMTQTWHNLLFLHAPIEPESLRPFLPPAVDLDTFDGQAWLGVVAFRLSKIRLRGLPEVGLISHFNEVNLRTYVSRAGHPGRAISEHGCRQPARDYAGSPPVRTSLHARGHDIRPHASRPPVQQRPYFRARHGRTIRGRIPPSRPSLHILLRHTRALAYRALLLLQRHEGSHV